MLPYAHPDKEGRGSSPYRPALLPRVATKVSEGGVKLDEAEAQ